MGAGAQKLKEDAPGERAVSRNHGLERPAPTPKNDLSPIPLDLRESTFENRWFRNQEGRERFEAFSPLASVSRPSAPSSPDGLCGGVRLGVDEAPRQLQGSSQGREFDTVNGEIPSPDPLFHTH